MPKLRAINNEVFFASKTETDKSQDSFFYIVYTVSVLLPYCKLNKLCLHSTLSTVSTVQTHWVRSSSVQCPSGLELVFLVQDSEYSGPTL